MSLNMNLKAPLKSALSLLRKEEPVAVGTFKEMVAPHKEHLYNYIFKALNFSEDADDLFQDTLLRAFKYIGGYDRAYPFKTWLFTIAHNEIKGYYKKNADRIRRGEAGPGFDTLDIPALEPGTRGSEGQLVRDIYEVAAGLEPRLRRVFFLFYDHGFSIREISGITGLKEGNIKFMLNRARERVKLKLGVGPRGDHHG